ncbi:hypothetical protein [Sphingopyxis sp.]|uniref:phage tail tube protein n=1 Tax=Sphingopyxis sp. TaxID=1908224 RepID=UPI0025F2D2C8|nr:hypothetical protein [Sphingopyxis sp.]MBK6414065.1 hypothetical protein [Sphingopyxis sp.]
MGSAFIGKAKVYIAPYASGSAFEARTFRYVENCSNFQFGFAEEEKKLLDYASASGGVDASVKRITDVTGSLDLRHLTADNLAMALWGTTTTSSSVAAITGEAGYTISPGGFAPTKKPIDTTVAPVVKKGATVISTADYTVTAGGILFASTISTVGITPGDAITIDYTPQASASIQSLISTAPDVSIMVEGVNEVDGSYVVWRGYKCKLGVASGISLIGDDFATLTVSFAVQKDETIVTAGKSKYFEMQAAA